MSHKRRTKDKDRPSIILFTLVILFFAINVITTCGLVSFILSDKRDTLNELCVQTGATIEYPSQLTFSVEYDKEPVDIQLIEPNGTVHSSDDYNADVTDTGSVISMTLITRNIGQWNVAYNHKTNDVCKPSLSIDCVDQLFLLNTEIEQVDNAFFVTTLPLYGDGSSTKEITLNVTFSSNTTKQSCIVATEHVPVNTTSTIKLDTSNMKTADDWSLTIVTCDPENIQDTTYVDHYKSDHYFSYKE